jgi:hypothetical protein
MKAIDEKVRQMVLSTADGRFYPKRLLYAMLKI